MAQLGHMSIPGPAKCVRGQESGSFYLTANRPVLWRGGEERVVGYIIEHKTDSVFDIAGLMLSQ